MQVSSTKQITKLEHLKESSLKFLAFARHTKTQNNMPQHATRTPSNILESQVKLDAAQEAQRKRYLVETLKNSTALGREIEVLRKSAGLSRRQVSKLLNVTYTNLFFIERPASARARITPQNQMRYLETVTQLVQDTKKAASNVTFVKRPGRPRKVLTEA